MLNKTQRRAFQGKSWQLLIAALIFYGSSFAQGFPGTDSLRNYNTRYITNNPNTAFTNLRLHTLIRGIIDWVDTARSGTGGGGAVGVDTLYALNDSTVRYRKNGVFRNVVVKGVYDYRRKVDTIYAVNDSTLGIKINGQTRSVLIRGNGLKISDTASMLTGYVRRTELRDTAAAIRSDIPAATTASNGLTKDGDDIRLGRQLGSGTPGADLLYDTEIPMNNKALLFISRQIPSEPYTEISKRGIDIYGDNGAGVPARIRLNNLQGGSFNITRNDTGTLMTFKGSYMSVRDRDSSLILTKTLNRPPTAFFDVDGTGRYRDTLTITTMDNADSSDRAASTAFAKRNGRVYANGYGLLLDGNEFKVDSTKIATLRAIQDSVGLVLNNFSLISRIEFLQGASTSATYQNDTLINKNITALEIQGYSVGFTPRTNSVYISGFDSSTGTITLTNGVFDAGDFVKILFRSPPIFLLGPDGWPIKDITGQYIILN